MQELLLNKAFMMLEPGPVVLVTTTSAGKANIMTISWLIKAYIIETRIRPVYIKTDHLHY